MLNFDDKLVRIPMPIIATLAPSQDTTSDQLAAFYRQPGIPFTRHSPLPVAASAPTNALINSAKKLLILLALLVCAGRTQATTSPTVTVQASSIDILGVSQPISITVNLIDPGNTGMLTVAGTGVVPIMRASTITPGTTVTVGPIYGNDVILNGYGVANATYYQVSVYTVNGGTIASTPSLQQFYALTGSGTIDLSTATPLAPSFMSSPTGVAIPGSLSVGGSATIFGPLSALGGLTTTSFTLTGATILCQFNTVAYVGGNCATTWGGGDIGAQINGAYTLLPVTGGTIVVLPQSAGGCYQFNTTINFTTVGKYVILQGSSPMSDSAGQVIGGSCIQFTATTAANAINIDWTPAAGGAYAPGGGIQNLAIVNSSTNGGSTQCTTVGGCASSANGVAIGGTNGGAHKGYFANVLVSGFGNGFKLLDASGIGWGISWNNVGFAHNTTGLNDTVGHENESCFGCIFGANGTAAFMNTGELSLLGGSTDSNVTAGISLGSGAVLKTFGMHWENLGSGNSGTDIVFVTGGSGTGFHSVNDEIVDDTSGGSTSQSFFTFGVGSINGLQFGSNSGRTYTGKAFNCLASCSVQAYMFNTGAFQTADAICPAAACAGNVNIQSNFTFSSAFSLTLSHSAQTVGTASPGSVYYVRDSTLGGTAIVTTDTNGSAVAVSGVVGAVVMVAGSPSAAQIGFTYASGVLKITGGSSTSADTVKFIQVPIN